MTLRRGASPVEGTWPARCRGSGDWYQEETGIVRLIRACRIFIPMLPRKQPDQPGPWV